MNLLQDLKMYGRFVRELPGHLRRKLTDGEAEDEFRRRLQRRDENFLRLVSQGVLKSTRSPYRWLLQMADCSLGDLESSVRQKGLEETLGELRREGVYVTFEEQKGRQPIVRRGKELQAKPHDFDNPFMSRHYELQTGGSTGAGTRVGIDLEHLASRAVQDCLLEAVFGYSGAPMAYYFGALPDHGLNCLLTNVVHGSVPERWFVPVGNGDHHSAFVFRAANALIPRLIRLSGVGVPTPEPVALNETDVIAQWMVSKIASAGRCVLCTHVSKAVRICLAAREQGWRLDGATIRIGGEPPTPAKIRIIKQSGAKPVPVYHMCEIGPLGFSCANPVDENDLHLLLDHLAVIQAPRDVPGFDEQLGALLFTTLLPTAPKLLINYEADDYGILEERSCGCPWEKFGLNLHVRKIRSYHKLTGEAITLVGSDVEKILDEVLPSRFGGTPLDYQMIEEEDQSGLTRLTLIVNPSVSISEDEAVIDCLLDQFGRLEGYQGISGSLLRQAKTLRIKREAPRWSGRTKLMPLRVET